jgi:4-hydroxybenzoate polyprenyltransferase
LASFVHGLLLTSGLLASTLCGWRYFAVLSVTVGGLVFYNRFSKRLGIFKDILAAALTTSLYPLALSLTDPVITPRFKSLYIFPVWLFMTGVGYEMLKDIRDIRGDNVVIEKRTFVSDSRFLLSARIFLVVAGALSLLPYILDYCGTVYLVSSVIAIVLVIAAITRPAVKAIPFIYAEVFLITAGALADLWVYGP